MDDYTFCREKRKRFEAELISPAVARPGGKHSMLDFDAFGASMLYFRTKTRRLAKFPFDERHQSLKEAVVEAWEWFQKNYPRYYELMSEGNMSIILTHE